MTYTDANDFERQAIDGYAREIIEENTPVYYHYQVRRSKETNNIVFK